MPLSTKQNAHGEVGAGFASLGGDASLGNSYKDYGDDYTMRGCNRQSNDKTMPGLVVKAAKGFCAIEIAFNGYQFVVRCVQVYEWIFLAGQPKTCPIVRTIERPITERIPIWNPRGFIQYGGKDEFLSWEMSEKQRLCKQHWLDGNQMNMRTLFSGVWLHNADGLNCGVI